jgi:hypothetical protein
MNPLIAHVYASSATKLCWRRQQSRDPARMVNHAQSWAAITQGPAYWGAVPALARFWRWHGSGAGTVLARAIAQSKDLSRIGTADVP